MKTITTLVLFFAFSYPAFAQQSITINEVLGFIDADTATVSRVMKKKKFRKSGGNPYRNDPKKFVQTFIFTNKKTGRVAEGLTNHNTAGEHLVEYSRGDTVTLKDFIEEIEKAGFILQETAQEDGSVWVRTTTYHKINVDKTWYRLKLYVAKGHFTMDVAKKNAK